MRKSKIFNPIRYPKEEKMNHNKFVIRTIALILVTVVVAGCASPTATPCPTAVPQQCPTAAMQECPTAAVQSCPTAAAQAMPEVNAWRSGYIPANVIITFDPGDKCSMKVIHPITGSDWNTSWNQLTYNIVVNDQTYQNYVMWIETLDPGKTLADLEAIPPTSTNTPPYYVHLLQADIVNPGSRTFHYGPVDNTEGPLYFTCMVQGPGGLRIISQLGPLEMPTK
jgi:hypothetical protein